MQKFKINQKNGQLNIQYKLKSSQSISQPELAVFSGKLIRGLMHPSVEGKKMIYVAPTATSLRIFLSRGIDKNTFFVIFAQVNELVKRIEKYGLKPENLVLDIEYVFINTTTKELQFIYQPLTGLESNGNTISAFLINLIQSTVITSGEPNDFLNFAYNFISSQPVYSTQKVDQYIANLYPQAFRQIVREQTAPSGKLTDKRYHVEKSGTGEKIVLNGVPGQGRGRNTSLLTAEQTDDTSLLQEMEVMDEQMQNTPPVDYSTTISTGNISGGSAPFQSSPINPFSPLVEEDTTFLTEQQMQGSWQQEAGVQNAYQPAGFQAMPFEEEEATSLLVEERASINTGFAPVHEEEEATSILEEEANFVPGIALPLEEEEATSLLVEEQGSFNTDAASTLLIAEQENMPSGVPLTFEEEEATSFLVEEQENSQSFETPIGQNPVTFETPQAIDSRGSIADSSGAAPSNITVAQPASVSAPSPSDVVPPRYEQPYTDAASIGGAAVTYQTGYTPDIYDEEEEEATALLTEENEGTKLVQSNVPDYPFLLRLSTYDRVEIKKSTFRIGKEKAKVDFFVPNNNAVSRIHADIIVRGNRFFIIDKKTTNGTFVNGSHIPPNVEYEIHEGDSVMLANEAFEFHIK